jgi:hypothetical protein
MILDFLARRPYLIQHLAPVWNALSASERGVFYFQGNDTKAYALLKLKSPKLVEYIEVNEQPGECGYGPILAAAYGDAVRAADFYLERPVILMEHGAGLTFGKPVFADGSGQRTKLACFPVQSKYVLGKIHPEIASKPHPIIGVPKLDRWAGQFDMPHPMPRKPTIAFAFHHGDKNSRPAETGSAWEHYAEILPAIVQHYKVLLHAHPLSELAITGLYQDLKNSAEFVPEWDDVMQRADLFIGDCGSAAYEFIVTGKPVILLNAPWFDRKKQWGLRFWDYTNIGPMVDGPEQLVPAIENTIARPNEYQLPRRRAVEDLFPYLGNSSQRAVEVIREFLDKKPLTATVKKAVPLPRARIKIEHLPIRTSFDRGIIYMCFGEAARMEMERSIASLRNVGSDLPVAIFGDPQTFSLNGAASEVSRIIPWKGASPFDAEKASHFQFRAGRVKPSVYDYSPFKHTMYIDCDTEFMQNPEPGFGFLNNWDFAIAQERLAVSQLYNMTRVGWQHNLQERDATIEAFGGSGDFPFWNSGVFFFRRNRAVADMFKAWDTEWHRWEQWDEQLALMRAANQSKARVFVMSEVWNYPHTDNDRAVIIHLYGRGAARMDAPEQEPVNENLR